MAAQSAAPAPARPPRPYTTAEGVAEARLRIAQCAREPEGGTLDLGGLSLDDAALAELAPAIAALPGLTSLNLRRNRIGPAGAQALSALTGLTTLDLLNNAIGDAGAAALAALTGLTTLNLAANGIGDAGFGHLLTLTKLKSLDLSITGVTALTPLFRMPQLRSLTLNGCHVRESYEALWLSEALEIVQFGEGSIRGIPPELLSTDYDDNCLPRLRAHVLDLLASDRDGASGHAIADVKVMLLGNGNVGKTQIARRLRGEAYDDAVRSTHGITVTKADLPTDDEGNPVTLRLWDFGGQDLYHGTHALFLKSRAVFPIVWSAHADDAGREHVRHGQRWRNDPLDYWLAYVKALGGRQSPVLLVQNKVDQPADRRPLPLPDDWTEGLDWHAAVKASARNPRGIEKLRHDLLDAVNWLRRTQGVTKIGGGRAAVKAKIEELQAAGQQTMTRAEFDALCAADGRISSPDLLLDFLHQIGTVFHRDGLFDDQIILDQEALLRAVYAVFDHEKSFRQIQRNGGRFDRPLLGALVWDEAGYSEKDQQQYIAFMRTSGMCFTLREASEGFPTEYIAPDLLPGRDDPAVQASIGGLDPGDAKATGKITFTLLPRGLLRTVMATVGEKAGRAGVYWRDGFSFFDAETKSRIVVEQAWSETWSGEISLAAFGGDAEQLLRATLKLLQDRITRFGARPKEIITSLDRTQDDERGARVDRSDPIDAVRPTHEPSSKLRWYVSYAWGDDASPEGAEREAAVVRFCDAAAARGIDIIRDKTHMKTGDSIEQFMAAIAEGDRVFLFVSAKSLASRYCMIELIETWRANGSKDDKFRARTRIYRLPDARLSTPEDRATIVGQWKLACADFDALMATHGDDAVADKDLIEHRKLKRALPELPNILREIQDRLRPKTFDDFLTYALAPNDD
jgi:internalin A